jgi:hypothetical protein
MVKIFRRSQKRPASTISGLVARENLGRGWVSKFPVGKVHVSISAVLAEFRAFANTPPPNQAACRW